MASPLNHHLMMMSGEELSHLLQNSLDYFPPALDDGGVVDAHGLAWQHL